jgi:selenide, water dikinase
MNVSQVRLTSLAHGGGCGCKLAPSVLQQLLADQPATVPFQQLLVGTETGDDAAVWQLDANTCIIATTDFFTPIVDDPFDFGRATGRRAPFRGHDQASPNPVTSVIAWTLSLRAVCDPRR